MTVHITIDDYWTRYRESLIETDIIKRQVLIVNEFDEDICRELKGYFIDRMPQLEGYMFVIDCAQKKPFRAIRDRLIAQPDYNGPQRWRENYFPTNRPVLLFFINYDEADEMSQHMLNRLVVMLPEGKYTELFPHRESIMVYHTKFPDDMEMRHIAQYCVLV